MPRRKNIRTEVDTKAKSGHLNCLDLDQHRTRESNLQRKAREGAIFEHSADMRPVSKLRFTSLGGGMNFNRGLNLISGPEMAELHQRLLKRMAEKPKALVKERRRMGLKFQEFSEKVEQELIRRSELEQEVIRLEEEKQQLQQQIMATPKPEQQIAASDIDPALPIRKRLKGYFPDEFLASCEAFDEVVWKLVGYSIIAS